MNINEEGKIEEAVVEGHGENKINESVNKSRDSKLNISKDSNQSKTLNSDDYKYELPDSCLITFIKKCKIEKLHKKYALVAHPYPILEGEMLIFQPLKSD